MYVKTSRIIALNCVKSISIWLLYKHIKRFFQNSQLKYRPERNHTPLYKSCLKYFSTTNNFYFLKIYSRALSHIDTDSIRKFNLFFQLWQLDPLWQTCCSSASRSIWKGGSQEPKFDLDLTRSDGSATSPNWSDRWFSGTDASAYWKHLPNTKWRTTLEQVNKV